MLYNFLLKNIIIISLIILTLIYIILTEIKEFLYKKNGISPKDAIKLINNNNAIIFDFRNEISYKKNYIINSINIPFDKINNNKNIINKYKKHIIIIIENKKNKHKIIINTLREYNCKNILYMINGIDSWIKNDLPTCKKD